MRPLLINTSYSFFGGAEKTLLYFVDELIRQDIEVAVATVKGSKLEESLPKGIEHIALPNNEKFSIQGLRAQLNLLRRQPRPSIIHGWTARDWELTTLYRLLTRTRAIGSLHDHPQAKYITPKRQRLMRFLANHGLSKTLCVSEAVRLACDRFGYRSSKLIRIHNGLPQLAESVRESREPDTPLRIGFLGVLAPHKGLAELFEIVNTLYTAKPQSAFHLKVAGDTQDSIGRSLVDSITKAHSKKQWWPNVEWLGWVDSPLSFLKSIDLLIVPSKAFDSFPTALLEAGQAGIPVLASDAGGAPEIVQHGTTGWIYPSDQPRIGAETLIDYIDNRVHLEAMGQRNFEVVRATFDISTMVTAYFRLYGSPS